MAQCVKLGNWTLWEICLAPQFTPLDAGFSVASLTFADFRQSRLGGSLQLFGLVDVAIERRFGYAHHVADFLDGMLTLFVEFDGELLLLER